MFQLLGRQLWLTRGGELFQQTHSIVLALAAIATFDKNTLAREMMIRKGHRWRSSSMHMEDNVNIV